MSKSRKEKAYEKHEKSNSWYNVSTFAYYNENNEWADCQMSSTIWLVYRDNVMGDFRVLWWYNIKKVNRKLK